MEHLTQKIVESLIKLIPEEWDQIMFYAEYEDGASDHFFYYFKKDSAEFIPSIEMAYILDLDHDEWYKSDRQIDVLIEELGDEFIRQERQPFTSLTLSISEEGQLKLDYGHEQLNDRPLPKTEEKFAETFVYPESKKRQKAGLPPQPEGWLSKIRNLFG
ncbi:immunity protein YezG family protein [Bhargavaea ullalensis]|uniref:DUF600 family protein n=1 Tax=Bhargavaea ullalensis TaxID=1265685 RepID=A0ABV2G9L0_9BACL